MRIDQSENPFLHALGIEWAVWTHDAAELLLPVASWQLNRQGTLQGGVISTLLDAACGYSGLFALPDERRKHAVTLSLSINFVARVSEGTVRAVGKRTGGGRKIFFADGALVSESGTLVATAQGSFKFTSAQNDPG